MAFSGFDYICELDREARYQQVSPNYEVALKRPASEILGRSVFELDILHPDELPRLTEELRPLFEDNQAVSLEYRIRDGNGNWRWMESSGNPFLNAAGEWRAVFISRDTTSRREAEVALAREEADYRSLVEHAVDAILLGNPRGEIIRANTRALELTGYSREELLGTSITGLFPPEELQRTPLRFDLLDQGLDVRSERWLVSKTGQRVLIEMNTRKLPDGRYQAFIRELTERHKAEVALRHSEAQYRTLFDHAPLGIFHFDSDSVIQLCNDPFLDIIGASRAAFTNFNMRRLLKNQGVLEAVECALRGERGSYEGEYLSVSAGRKTQVRILTFGVWDEDGRVIGGIGIVEDTTERWNAERALASESALLRDVIEHNPMSIQTLGTDGRTLSTNSAFVRLFGARPPADYSIFSDPLLERQGLSSLIDKVRQGEVVFFPEFFYNPRDLSPELPDSPVWIRMVAFPILGTSGLPERYVLMHEDVTEERRSQQALKESEAQNRALLNAIPDLIFLNRRDGVFLAFHASDPSTLFAPPEQFLHRRADEVFPAEFAQRFTQAYETALDTDSVQYLDYSLPIAGEESHFEARIVPCTVDTVITIVRDITQEKRTEAMLRQAQKLESLGVLAGGIAHDFNNLLTAVMGNLNLAQLKLQPAAPAQPHLEAIEKIVLKASDLTRQMLAYSGKGRFVVKFHDLNEVVKEMGHLLQVSISKKVTLGLRLADSLPRIEGDAAQIQQVIMNLVTNASDAIGDEEGRIGITTRREDLTSLFLNQTFPAQDLVPGPYATLEVSDTGCGIPPEVLPKIFDPFFSTKSSGRGLGLSAMQGILRGHGAGIKIYSEVGKGTTFKVYFPIRDNVEPLSAEPAAGASIEAPLHGLVLAVDDEPTILETLEGALRAFGLDVITARDGQEALERFRAETRRIDLVVMDLTMPRMDGREAFRQLRQLCPSIRVLLSSGYNEQESLQEFMGKGLAGFIQKPYLLRELKTAVIAAMAPLSAE